MTDRENYLAAASRIAAGICAARPELPFGTRPDATNDLVAQCACEITDLLLTRASKTEWLPQELLGVPAARSVAEDDGQTE